MGIILGLIGSALGLGKDLFTSWRDNKAKVAEAEQALKLAYIENKTRLMLSKDEYNHSWEMEALKNSSRSLKWGSFILFAGPMAFTILSGYCGFEDRAQAGWTALNMVPEYWRYGFTAMTGSIWGVACLKDMGGIRALVGGFAGGAGGPSAASSPSPDPKDQDAAATQALADQALSGARQALGFGQAETPDTSGLDKAVETDGKGLWQLIKTLTR